MKNITKERITDFLSMINEEFNEANHNDTCAINGKYLTVIKFGKDNCKYVFNVEEAEVWFQFYKGNFSVFATHGKIFYQEIAKFEKGKMEQVYSLWEDEPLFDFMKKIRNEIHSLFEEKYQDLKCHLNAQKNYGLFYKKSV